VVVRVVVRVVSLCLRFEVEALLDYEVVNFSRGKGRNKKPKAFNRFLIEWANYTEDITSGSQKRDF